MEYLILHLLINIITSSLIEPTQIEMLPGIDYHFSIEYCDFSVPPYITSMNAHCYCTFNPNTQQSSLCSIPGPTFIFHPGDTISMTWHNRMSGDSVSNPSFLNQMRDLDITNIHNHGPHLNPNEDDVLIEILPGQQHTYTYTIPPHHYPGTHWLHAHHHGSVSFQVTSGLFSALLIKYKNPNDLMDINLINLKENLLIFHWIYVVTNDVCDCSHGESWQPLYYYPPAFQVADCISGRLCVRVFSLCYEYCSMPQSQRDLSGYTYNMQSDHLPQFQLFLVNGQFEPIIDDLTVNKYRRLRFINAMSAFYIQYKLPIAVCQWYILAIDGIFLLQARHLNISPYFGEYLLPPGGRLDVIVKCSVAGIYDIFTSENNAVDSELRHMNRAPTGNKLFQIKVNNIGNDIVTQVPFIFPQRPQYLKDLRTVAISDLNACACNTYFSSDIPNQRKFVKWTEKECGFVFNMVGSHNINGIVFNYEPMTSLEYGKVYEFKIIPHLHPYHQHVNPFQVQQDIGTNGFQAKAGDFFDTLGGSKTVQYLIRTYPIDFTGKQVVHCHILHHEDIGMMTFMNILQPQQICDTNTGLIVG